jgi:hypothetical protein
MASQADPRMPDVSPFAQGYQQLVEFGFHVIPVLPADKAPGERSNGRWRALTGWPQFRDRKPTIFELTAWKSWPRANIGIVTGTAIGPYKLLVVDVDSLDPEEVEAILSAVPASAMSKKALKGASLFFRAPDTIKSKGYNIKGKRVVDLLAAGRQTVAAPSAHPHGGLYRWLAGPVPADELPIFDDACLERLEDTLAHLGWGGDVVESARVTRKPLERHDDDPSVWEEVNRAALANLDAWVSQLGLHDLRTTGRRGGFEAVATWRPSGGGQPLEQRKRNLQIHPDGIRDFGADVGYSPLDLVCAANNWALDDAFRWLKDRLDLSSEPVFSVPPPVVERVATPCAAPGAPVEREAVVVPIARPREATRPDGELPAHLLNVPGLVGDIRQWITDTARRPQPAMALASALCVLGTAAGRVYAGPTDSGTHLFVICLAPTSGGKDHGLKQARRLLDECGLKQANAKGQYMSMSALAKRLQRQPLTLNTIDELGSYLGRINHRKATPHEKAITGLLREAWGSSFEDISTPEWANEPARDIECPALSLLGVSTHEDLFAGFQDGDIQNGFLNRFLLVSTQQRVEEQEPVIADKFAVPALLANNLRLVVDMGGTLHRATMHNGRSDGSAVRVVWDNPAAKAVYAEFGKQIQVREEDRAFLGRTVEMALRLATIRAIGIDRQTPRITVEDMTWGRDLALWSGEQMILQAGSFMAESDTERELNRLLRKVRELGSVERWKLLKFYKKDKRGFDVLMDTLIARGDVIGETVGAGKIYVAA